MNAALPDLDARLHASFAARGMADVAAYAPPAGGMSVAGDRRCYVNTNRQTFGDAGNLSAPRTVVGVLLADGSVERGGSLVIGVVTYRLQRLDETDQADESLEWWVVVRG